MPHLMDYWSDLLNNAVILNGPTNFKHEFKVLTRRFGKAYKEYIKISYQVKDNQLSDESFCLLNHLPINLLDKFIK